MSDQQKVVWITGASSGIGEALCLEYARSGYSIILSARREEELLRVKNSLSDPSKSSVMVLDISNIEKAPSNVKTAVDIYGRIDVLILNAGISQRSLAVETDLSVDRKIMEINYFGQIALSKAILPHFKKRRAGHFVVISSLTGKFGFFLRSAYAASKHALHGFFESLRLEEEDNGVKITMICPTLIKTSISKSAIDGSGDSFGKMDPLQEGGIEPEECASQIFKAQQKGKLEVVIGKKKISVLLKRFVPNVFHKLIKKQKPSL